MVFVEGCVSGMAYLDDRMYIVYRLLNTIHVFSADLTTELEVIKVRGLRYPLDIVVSHSADRQLYVADSGDSDSEECILWCSCICYQRAAAPCSPVQLFHVLLWSSCTCSRNSCSVPCALTLHNAPLELLSVLRGQLGELCFRGMYLESVGGQPQPVCEVAERWVV